MVFPNSHVARVTGFYNIDRGYAKGILEKTILDQLEEDERHLRFEVEIVPSCNSKDRCIGIVDFEQGFPQFLTTLRPAQQIDGEIERNYDRQMGVRLEIFFAKSQNRAILTFDADFLGFTQLYSIDRGKYPEIVADIIAVTGLNAHTYGSWKCRGDGTMWLRHFFRYSFPNCRTMIFGCNTKLEDDSQLDLHGLSLQFRNALGSIWPEEGSTRPRPLILIGHSLGGLIVSRAVADGHDHRNAHGLRNPFVNPVCAYVLFGVPFFGLYTADLEAALPVNSSRQTLVRQLGHDYQERKIEQFIEKVKRDRAQVINIQENRHTRAIQKVDGKIVLVDVKVQRVDSDAASLKLPSNIEAFLPRDCDHSELSRFWDMEDSEYNSIVKFIENRLKAHQSEQAWRSRAILLRCSKIFTSILALFLLLVIVKGPASITSRSHWPQDILTETAESDMTPWICSNSCGMTPTMD